MKKRPYPTYTPDENNLPEPIRKWPYAEERKPMFITPYGLLVLCGIIGVVGVVYVSILYFFDII